MCRTSRIHLFPRCRNQRYLIQKLTFQRELLLAKRWLRSVMRWMILPLRALPKRGSTTSIRKKPFLFPIANIKINFKMVPHKSGRETHDDETFLFTGVHDYLRPGVARIPTSCRIVVRKPLY